MKRSFPILWLVPFALVAAQPAVAGPPNIVLVMVDDMGYGDPGCYNAASRISTPAIDRIAAEGMRFTDAHAPGPLCHLSRYGLMTGRYPFRANTGGWANEPTIDADRVTIASLLKSQGYRTAMVGKWHLGFHEEGDEATDRYTRPLPGGPVDRGFESFFGIRASTDIPPYFYIRGNRAVAPPTERIEANASEGWSPIQGAFWRAGGIAPDLALKDVLPRFTEEAIGVVREHAKANDGEPLFLYLAYPAPHTPWLPAEEFAGKSQAGMYGDFATMVDAQVGRLRTALDEVQLTEETLVILTSDNGPVWYDEDRERLGHDSCGGLRGMKADAWEAGHRMPFVVRWPGRVKAGTVSRQTICFTDLLATFAAITGTELPKGAGPDSVNVLPALLGERPEDRPLRTSLVIRSGRGLTTVRMGDWKLIDGLGSGGFSKPNKVNPEPGGPTGQLYDLARDPAETTNLFAEQPKVVARLQAEWQRVRDAER